MSIHILILANFIFNWGVFNLTQPDNILWFLSCDRLGKWGKPLTECIECMSSFWGLLWFGVWVYLYMPIETLAFAPVYVICLYGVAIIAKAILNGLDALKMACRIYGDVNLNGD